MVGQQLAGRYEVLRPLARGGMGVVYVAHDPLLDREVAVKVVPPELLTPETEQRFLREARLVARLDHPGIVTIHDFGRQDGSLFFVMPLLKGESLRALLGRRRLSAREVVELGIQVAEALEHSHQAGVVHRDVKPENVMVLREAGPGLRARVMDFGIALSSTSTRLTLAGTVFGTLAYLSPEQLGGGVVDGRSDVYGLGAVLYECLAGQAPFTGDVQMVLYSIAHEPPPALSAPDVDPELARLVMSCLAKQPGDRPASAGEVAEALARRREHASDGAPVAAARPRARLAAEAPLVGREAVVAEITQRLDRSREGECHVVLVGGEPGMGKSRLLAEAERLAALRGARVLHGRFLERHDAAFPYHGYGEALAESVQRARAKGEPDPLTADLRERLGGLFPALLDSDALPARVPGAAPASRADVFELLAAAFLRLAARGPLVLLLEDLHEADVSLDALQYLQRRLASAPLLVLGTYRSNEVAPEHELRRLARAAERDTRAAHLLLGPLAAPDRERLLWLLLHGQPVPVEVAGQVCEASEGNPFFLGELLRTLLDEGRLVQDAAGTWTGARTEAGLFPALPGSLQQVVARRIEALGPDERELLEHAAVLGRSFAEPELELLGEVPEAALDELLSAQYLEEERARPGRLSFASALLREVVYAGIAPRRRRALHRRCAEELEAAARREPPAGRLAQHYAAAGLPERAAPLALKAAGRALASGLADDAARLAEVALQAAADESWDAPVSLRAAARVCLARAHALAGRAGDAVDELARALEGLEAGPERLDTLVTAAEIAWSDRRVEQARAWVDEAAALAARLGDAASREALDALSSAIAERGGVRDAASAGTASLPLPPADGEWLARGEYLAVLDALDQAGSGTLEPGVEATYHERLATLAASQGRLPEVLEHLRRAARVLAAPGHADRLAAVEARAASVSADQGALEDAQLWLERAQARVEGGEAHGPALLGALAAARCDVLAAAGQARAALDAARLGLSTCAADQVPALQARLLRAALAAGDDDAARDVAPEVARAPRAEVDDDAGRHEALSAYHLAAGAPESAADAAREGLARAEEAGAGCWRARLHLAAAGADLARGAVEDAEENLLRASREAERTRALPDLLAAQVGLARVALVQGRVLAAEIAARLALELAGPAGLAAVGAAARLALAAALAPAHLPAARAEIEAARSAAEALGHHALRRAAVRAAAEAELEHGSAESAVTFAQVLRADTVGPPRAAAAAQLLVARAEHAARSATASAAATRALQQALAAGDLHTAHAAHHLLADAAEGADALYHARVATELAEALGPGATRDRASSALLLARVHQVQGDRAAAAAALGRGLAAAVESRSGAVLARAHLAAAGALEVHDPERALALLAEARRLAAAVDVPATEWRACRRAASVALRLGRLDEVVENLRREETVRSRAGLPEGGPSARTLMAAAYHALGDLAEAHRLLAPDGPSSAGPEAGGLELLRARVLLDSGQLDLASAALERVGAAPGAGVLAAELALWAGDVGRALAELDAARQRLGETPEHDLEGGRTRERLRLGGARAALRGGFPEAALTPADEARRFFTSAGCAVDATEAALVLAEARARSGRGDAAEPLDAAEDAADRLGLGGLKVDARLLRARIHRSAGLAGEAWQRALTLGSPPRVAEAAQVAAELHEGDADGPEWQARAASALGQLTLASGSPLPRLGFWGPEPRLR